MLEIREMDKEQLDDELRRMDIEKDDMEMKLKEFQSYREEVDADNKHVYWKFESMREKFNSANPKIISLIDEGEAQLDVLIKHDRELTESVHELRKIKQTKWDMREEDIYLQMDRLQESKEDK